MLPKTNQPQTSSEPESFESLGDFHSTPKMDNLKPISHKEFNEFMMSKGFKRRKDYALRDLKAKFGFKPLVKRRVFVVSLEGMEPTKFDSIRKADEGLDVGKGVIRYERNNMRDFVKRLEDENIKVFSIKWC